MCGLDIMLLLCVESEHVHVWLFFIYMHDIFWQVTTFLADDRIKTYLVQTTKLMKWNKQSGYCLEKISLTVCMSTFLINSANHINMLKSFCYLKNILPLDHFANIYHNLSIRLTI